MPPSRASTGMPGPLAERPEDLGFRIWIPLPVAALGVLLSLVAGLLVLGRKASPRGAQVALVFLAVQLSLSVFSRSDYLFTPGTSDVGAIESALFLPYWFWGAVCGGFSVVVLAIGAFAFLRGRGLAGGRGAEV